MKDNGRFEVSQCGLFHSCHSCFKDSLLLVCCLLLDKVQNLLVESSSSATLYVSKAVPGKYIAALTMRDNAMLRSAVNTVKCIYIVIRLRLSQYTAFVYRMYMNIDAYVHIYHTRMRPDHYALHNHSLLFHCLVFCCIS